MRGKDFNTGLRGTLFEAKHYERMSSAVWLYGWLVLRSDATGRNDGLGAWGKANQLSRDRGGDGIPAENTRALDARPARSRLHRNADGSGRHDRPNHQGKKVLPWDASTQFCGRAPRKCGGEYANLRRRSYARR